MAGRDGGSVDTARGVFRVILILAIGLALAGAFGSGLRPANTVSVPGLALMVLGVAAVFGARHIAPKLAREAPDRVELVLKLAGVLLCGAGAILIICL